MQMSHAMTDFGLSVTNSISQKLTNGLLGSSTAALGSGVASIIPLEDSKPTLNLNKPFISAGSSVIDDASNLGPGLFFPNKGWGNLFGGGHHTQTSVNVGPKPSSTACGSC